MKHTGIHILDFNDKIIDFISQSDGALINAVMSTNAEEKSETFDFTVLNDRAENLRERNRIISQDNNGIYREFIISHVVDNFDGTTDIESNASYLEDIDKSRPIKPGKYSSHSTSQALNETLRNTGWEMSDDTEHGGMRTTSWTSYSTPYEVINMLCTTYDMVAEYYIELGSHTVEHRYVTLKKPVSLFKGKEITKGKDLTGMTRTVDMSEVRTALFAIGPENDTGQRLEKIVTDDDAQAQFGLPGRYLWSVYEPESDDSNMTDERLTTLAKTELNKRNKSAISYEITSTDIRKHYPEMVVSLHDTVRIKDRDFRPPLYIEAEVIGVDYNLLTDESSYKFGNVIEYEESSLRDIFNKKLADISKKLNDNVTNINTIVADVVEGQLEYFEPKIFKSETEPQNPVQDMLWYDTSNPNVAVLRRYYNGEWINETAQNVKQLGGMSREETLYNTLTNTFQNLSIQHAQLIENVSALQNNEYLIDEDLKGQLDIKSNAVINVYQHIKTNLDDMTAETATIGNLIDTQALFLDYREQLQDLYKAMRDAQVSADKRLQLLQSQYTDEKFKNALLNVADKFGLVVNENNQLVGTPNAVEQAIQAAREDTQEQLKSYVRSVDYEIDQEGIVERLDTSETERKQLSNQILDRVTKEEYDNETTKRLSTTKAETLTESEQISQRVSKDVFDESSKTLNSVVSQIINNTTTGISLSYDDNGNIQSSTIGPNGINLKGDKVDITVNKDFKVVTQNLNNKVGKDEVVNRLNLSNEGLDINVNKLGIVGGDSTNSLTIRNNQILSRGKYSRTWSGVTDTPNATVGIRNGYIMSSNEDTGYNLYMTEKGLSTMMSGGLGSEQAGALEFHYDLMNDKSRGVRLSSTYGVVFLQAEQSRIYTRSRFTTNIETWEGSIYLRPWAGGRVGANEFSFYIKQNDTAQFTDGVLLFGEISNETNIPGYGNAGSGIRFRKAGMPTETYGDYEPIVYATNNAGDIGSGSFYGNRLYGDWTTKTDNLYACVNDKLRITDIKGYNSGNTNYKDLQCKDIQANTIRVNTGNNFYLGVSTGELRVTNNLMYNGGDIGYKPVVASDFVKASRAEYKKDISLWKTDALRTIAEDLDLYSYKYKEDEQEIIHHGPVIGDDYKTPNVFVTGDGINTNELLTYALKAIQQLNEKVEKLEEQINGK